MEQHYTPSQTILKKYADLIVEFGLQTRSGRQLEKGSVVQCTVPEVAKPLYFHLQASLLKHGYNILPFFIPSNEKSYNFDQNFFDHAGNDQLDFYPAKFHKGLIDQIDASIYVIAETNPHALKSIDSKRVLRRSLASKPAKDMRFKKIDRGELSWTLALYGTDAMAREAGMSSREYWNQIIRACYLDSKDPVKEWNNINRTVQKTAETLTKMKIKKVHIAGEDMDLTIGIGKDRAWRAGGGNNIPSYEVFTSPNYREVNGWARFSEPHYRYGKKIEGIELWFKNGVVTKSKASKNHDLLRSMLATPGGNRLGEFSLTDARLSRITKFMAEILFDENTGGKYGNTHVALGSAYRDCYQGDPKEVKEKEWNTMGYNNSVVHSDIISTTDRTVVATLQNGEKRTIYRDGKFLI